MNTYFKSLLAVGHFNFDLIIEPKEKYSAFKEILYL